MSTAPERCSKVVVAPLMPLALALGAGIAVDRSFEPCGTLTWLLIALGAVGAIAVGAWRRTWAWDLALGIAFASLGGGWHHHRWSDVGPDDLARRVSERPRPAWVRGVLGEVLGLRPGLGPSDPGGTRAVLELTGIRDGGRWQDASGRAQLFVVGDRTDLRAGESVEVAGALARLEGPLNPGEFDFRNHQRADGIRLRLSVDDPKSLWRDRAGAWWPFTRWRGAVRTWSQARLVDGHDARIAPLAAALVLGRREGVDPDVNDAFARTGTTHLLAISGLHLQVLALAVGVMLRAFGVGRRPTFAVVGLATLGYALLVGLAPSVVRSAAMTVTCCLAGLKSRPTRPANILALAALVTLAFNPSDLFDVGCQLSFLAVAAIVWGSTPLSDWLKRSELSPLDALERRYEPRWRTLVRRGVRPGLEGLILSMVVWLAAWPLVALRFHLISPIGVLLNVPLVPITSAALLASGLSLGLSTIWGPLGAPAAWVGSVFLRWTEAIVRWGSAWRWGHWFVPEPSWVWVLGFYVLLGLATASGVGRWRLRTWAWGALGIWTVVGLGMAWFPRRPDAMEADVLAVGHGLAVVVQTPDGRAFVYDCGRMRDPSIGRRVIAPALWARGVRRIEAVILSHADADHYNGLPDLLDRFAIGAVRVTPGFAGAANPEAVRLLSMVRARGVPVETIAEGAHWEAAEARFAVWHPPRDWHPTAKDNARSLVLDLESEGRHALLTGDLEEDGLVQLVSRPKPKPAPDVFLAPHHGGRSANPEWLYLWARPAQVVVSQRPPVPGTRDALAPLDAQGIPLLRTWQRGAIRLRWTPIGIIASGFADSINNRFETSNLTFPMFPLPFAIHPAWSHGLVAFLGFGLGLGLCMGLLVVEWGAWALVAPGRKLGMPEPEPDPVLGEPIEARGFDGVRLAGLWHPAEPATGRTVLLVHGFAEDPSTLHNRVEGLLRHGWNVATLDQRAHGRSEGARVSFGGRESDDLRAWIDVLAGRVGPTLRPAAWGRSMGAGIATRAAADDPRLIALVLEAPYLDLIAAIGGWLRRLHIPATGLFARLIARRAERLAGVSLTRPRPLDLAPRIHAPILIVHGEKDPLIPLADAQRLAIAFPRPATVIEVPGAGHTNAIDVGGPALLDRIAAFLEGVVAN